MAAVSFHLTVAVPAFNNADLLELTLESLTRQTLEPERFDVVVVDDGSEPSLAPVVQRLQARFRLRYVRQAVNRGRAATRNRALEAATGDAVLFLDADSCAHPDLLARHWRFHADRQGSPAVLVGRRYEIDWAGVDALKRGETLAPPLIGEYRDDTRDGVLLPAHRRRDWVRAPWLYAFTHNVSVDVSSVVTVGGFDEQIVGWGCEDIDLFYRVFHLHDGRPEVFQLDEDAICYHLPHFRLWPDLAGQMRDNHAYLQRKHPRLDMEVVNLMGSYAIAVKRIVWYGDAIGAARSRGLANVRCLPDAYSKELVDEDCLVVGLGGAVVGPPGRVTFDHDAPLTETNLHLIGLRTPFAPGRFRRVVNVDLWRFLAPEDLSTLIVEALRIADRLDLIATAADVDPVTVLPLPFVGDIEYVHDMTRAHFPAELTHLDAVTVLTLRENVVEPTFEKSARPA